MDTRRNLGEIKQSTFGESDMQSLIEGQMKNNHICNECAKSPGLRYCIHAIKGLPKGMRLAYPLDFYILRFWNLEDERMMSIHPTNQFRLVVIEWGQWNQYHWSEGQLIGQWTTTSQCVQFLNEYTGYELDLIF